MIEETIQVDRVQWTRRKSGHWSSPDRTGPHPMWGDIDLLCNAIVVLRNALAEAQKGTP